MFKLLRWVGVFLTMTSGISYAMEPPSSDDMAFKKTILKQAIDFCDQYIDFETDTIEFYQKDKRLQSEQSVNNHDNSFSYERVIEGVSRNISTMTKLKSELEDETQFHAETFLSALLDTRFSLLASRKNMMQGIRSLMMENMDNIKQGKPVGGPTYGPTRPSDFEKLTPYQQTLARISTDRYQTINRLIVLMWKLVDPRTLKPQTKLKVRASTSLWDNLMGKREYLGHPDEAILVYEDGSDLPNITLYGTDMELYNDHIKEQKITIDLLGWNKGKRAEIKTTIYEVSLWDQRQSFYKKKPEAPYPGWLKPYPKLESIPAKAPSLEAPQKTKKSTGPSLAKKRKIAHKKRDHKVTPSFSEPKPPIEAVNGEEHNSQISPVEITPAMSKEDEEEKVESISTTEEEKSDKDKEESSMEVEEVHNDPASIDEKVDSFKDYVRPAGMRRFHARSLQKEATIENKITLKGAHLSTRDEIFNPKQFKNVSFGQFKSLWKHISGEKSVIESNGSSHKKLIGPNGEVFGTFAHGDNMTYGSRTIKYIRDALLQIGYGPFSEK